MLFCRRGIIAEILCRFEAPWPIGLWSASSLLLSSGTSIPSTTSKLFYPEPFLSSVAIHPPRMRAISLEVNQVIVVFPAFTTQDLHLVSAKRAVCPAKLTLLFSRGHDYIFYHSSDGEYDCRHGHGYIFQASPAPLPFVTANIVPLPSLATTFLCHKSCLSP